MVNVYLIILSLIGFIVSFYIWNKKRKKETLVCLIGQRTCDEVIHSKYSKTFGIPNEVGGMLYYVVVLIISVFSLSNLNSFLLVISGIAALASLYLTFIQLFKLKNFCEYCLVTALVNILIFLVIYF
tara:strand:+ start:6980 stop:7360 length:381 start_codon:yes stop_codon:yes gene_type:complete